MRLANSPRTRERIALGVCVICLDADAEKGKQRCSVCRKKKSAFDRRRWRERKAAGWRRSPETMRSRALSCNTKRMERAVAGQCLRCGVLVTKFTNCPKCRRAGAEAQKRWRDKRRAA